MTSEITKEQLFTAMFELYCALAAGTVHCRVEVEGDETQGWVIPSEFFSRDNVDHVIQVLSPLKKRLPHRTAKFLWKFLKQKGAPPPLVITFNPEEAKAAFPISLLEQERMPNSKMEH